MPILVVVANQFQEFSRHSNVLSHEALLDMLMHRNDSLRGTRVIAGQGLDARELRHVHQLAIAQGYREEFAHWHAWAAAAPASRDLSHKRRPENVLISTPQACADGGYCARLVLHPHNELMLDHLTGQHVQGMVLLEACRQMFLAVTERFHLDGFEPAQRYFVLNEMSVRYTAFTFPLPAEIRYRLLKKEHPRPDRVDVSAEMDVWQADKAVTCVGVDFSVMDGNRLSAREASLASQALTEQAQLMRKSLDASPSQDAMTEPISTL